MAEDYDERDEEARDGDPQDDGPRRRRRSYRDEPPPAPQVSVLGIFALVQGIISLLVSLIPCIGAFGIIGGVFGLLLGLIALLLAKNSEGRIGLGMPVAAISINLGGMIIAGLWIALLAGAFKNNANAPPPEEAENQNPLVGPGAAGAPALVVSAAELDREYDRNEPAADLKYKGKWIEVTGKVVRVTGDTRPRKMTLELDADTTVDCVFALDKKADLATLKPNESVTVRGRCRGKVDGSVTLEDCVRTAREPEKAVEPPETVTRVSATELFKAFDENVVAADAKYKGQVLEVSGKVQKVLRGDRSKTTLLLRTEDEDGFATINCDFLTQDAAALGALKAGQAVLVRGKCLGQPDGFGPVTLDRCSVVK